MAYGQPRREPDPTSAAGVLFSMFEGIALALLNWYVTLFFGILSDVQQQLDPQNPAFSLDTIFLSWAIAYFFLAYVAPIVAAYIWADKIGVTVYCVGWLGATALLNGSFTGGMILLVVACFLVLIVDILKNASKGRNRRGRGRPPVR